MSADDDLRHALRAEAEHYDPADDGWAGISAGVRVAQRRRRIQAGVLGGLAMSGLALAIGLTAGGGSTDVDAGRELVPAGTTQEEAEVAPPATEAPATTPPATAPVAGGAPATTAPQPPAPAPAPAGPFPGIWPFSTQEAVDGHGDGNGPTFDVTDAAVTAEAFARDYIGMLDPVVGDAEPAGDGEVTVDLRQRGEDGRPLGAAGPVTVVTLRSFASSDGPVWSAVGARSANVVVDEPAAGAQIASPLTVRGRATGYEGTVAAEVREDGMAAGQHLGQEVGIAGTGGELGPLALAVPFDRPAGGAGALLVTTDTGRDGVGVWEATVVKVVFDEAAAGPGPGPGRTDCRVSPPAGEPTAAQMDVTAFFVCDAAVQAGDGVDAALVPVVRRVPRDAGVLRATLRAFLAGTSAEDDERGVSAFTSSSSSDQSGTEVRVSITDGTAVVDFDASLTVTADAASTSAGSELFQGALNRTVLQFATVERVEYRLGGSCDAFWEWQQAGGCRPVTRDDL